MFFKIRPYPAPLSVLFVDTPQTLAVDALLNLTIKDTYLFSMKQRNLPRTLIICSPTLPLPKRIERRYFDRLSTGNADPPAGG